MGAKEEEAEIDGRRSEVGAGEGIHICSEEEIHARRLEEGKACVPQEEEAIHVRRQEEKFHVQAAVEVIRARI